MLPSRVHFFLFALFLMPFVADAHELHGTWTSVKFTGTPCAELVEKINYSFSPDGSYEVHTWMRSFGGVREMEAIGTYAIKDDKVTAHVEGYTVGPYKVAFENGELIIYDPSPSCVIRLKRLQ